MKQECKLLIDTGVYCTEKWQSGAVVDYLKQCKIPNPEDFRGTDSSAHYGHDKLGHIKGTSGNNFKHTITFEEFEELIAEPVINNTFPIY